MNDTVEIFIGHDGDEATYTDIAESIRMYSSAPTEDLHELWRRMVFNVLTGNLDDHLRNHDFIRSFFSLADYTAKQKARALPVKSEQFTFIRQ